MDENQRRILTFAKRAVHGGAKLLVFPETAATGLVNIGVPARDLLLAEEMTGTRIAQWQEFARRHRVYFAAGFFEKKDTCLFDSAILYNPSGEIALHYRRIDPGWLSEFDDKSIYLSGETIPVIPTSFGRTAFLICGDLWDNQIIHDLKVQKPELVLYLFARSFDTANEASCTWAEEMKAYVTRWTLLNTKVVAVNLLGDGTYDKSIGGSWFWDPKGRLIETSRILQESFSILDI